MKKILFIILLLSSTIFAQSNLYSNWIRGTGSYSVDEVDASERVVNGGFDTDSDWTKPNSWRIVNGYAEKYLDNEGQYQQFAQNIGLVDNNVYLIEFDYNISGEGLLLYAGGAGAGSILETIPIGSGTYSEAKTVSGSSGQIGFGALANTTLCTIDNISVKEVTSDYVVDGTKYLECTSAGTIALQSETAYGTTEFDVLKTDASFVGVFFIGTNKNNHLSGDKYMFRLSNSEDVQMRKYTGGGSSVLFGSASGYVNPNQWYHVKITRTTDGEFYTYLDGALVSVTGGSGTNPVTSTDYSTSRYLVLDFDVGDRISSILIKNNVEQ